MIKNEEPELTLELSGDDYYRAMTYLLTEGEYNTMVLQTEGELTPENCWKARKEQLKNECRN